MRPNPVKAFALAALFGSATLFAAPAAAQDRDEQVERAPRPATPVVNSLREQDRAFERRQQGRAMPLRQLERQIVPRMRGYEYLGPEARGNIYRFKFVREGRVVWVDVDPRNGRVVGTSGR